MIASCCTRLRILPGIIFSKLAILIVITFLLLSVGTSTSDAMSAKVEDLRIGLKNSTTRLVIEVDQKISPYVFGLANPYRIVIDLPKVNGREVKVAARSPLAKAQHMQDISDVNRFNEIIAGTFGPQMINVIVNQNETAKYLAEKMNLPEKLIRDEQEQQQIVQQISQLQSSASEGEVPQ